MTDLLERGSRAVECAGESPASRIRRDREPGTRSAGDRRVVRTELRTWRSCRIESVCGHLGPPPARARRGVRPLSPPVRVRDACAAGPAGTRSRAMSKRRLIAVSLVVAMTVTAAALWKTRPWAIKADSESRSIASGTVDATEVSISFRVPGILRNRPVDEGSVVKAGDVLAELDTREASARLRQAQAAEQGRAGPAEGHGTGLSPAGDRRGESAGPARPGQSREPAGRGEAIRDSLPDGRGEPPAARQGRDGRGSGAGTAAGRGRAPEAAAKRVPQGNHHRCAGAGQRRRRLRWRPCASRWRTCRSKSTIDGTRHSQACRAWVKPSPPGDPW